MPVRTGDKSRAKTFAGVSLPYLEYKGNREQETRNAEGFRCNLFVDEMRHIQGFMPYSNKGRPCPQSPH
jgi:hypothetical protein